MVQRLEEKVRRYRDDILHVFGKRGITRVWLFGSVVREESRPDSDLDLMFEPPDGFSLLAHAAVARELAELLGCRVDLVSPRGLKPRIRQRVMAEAVPL